jgi:DNA polymerase III subunit alpha
VPVYLFTKKERKKYRLDREFWVKNSLELMTDLRNRFGDENVKLS